MAISWNLYLSRRKVNLTLWVKVNDVKSYDDMQRVCTSKGVRAPSEDVYNNTIKPLLETAEADNRKAPAKKGTDKSAPSKPAKKKNTTSSSVGKKPVAKNKPGVK